MYTNSSDQQKPQNRGFAKFRFHYTSENAYRLWYFYIKLESFEIQTRKI